MEISFNAASLILSLDLTSILVVVIVFLLVVLIRSYYQVPENLPPGPVGWPVLGVIPRLGKTPYLTIQAWWKKYGDVFSIYMGSRLVVIINGVEGMKEAMSKQGDIFSGRPWNYFKKLTGNAGIVFTEGEVWREHRRFTLTCLRDFGMGKVCLEKKIHEEASELINAIVAYDGKPFDPREVLPKAISNIICSIIYGNRFDYEDDIFANNIHALDQSVRNQTLLGTINFIPFLEVFTKIIPTSKMLMRNVRMRAEYASHQMESHKQSLDADNPRDFIDAYLIRMNNLKAKKESTTFEDKQLHRTIQDLFIAGTETINTTLKWSILYMMVHQDVQRKVQEEIDQVLGCKRMATIKDKAKMPYTEATIMECQRLGNIALFSVPRCTTEDTKLYGYDIPKGTWIFVNRWGMHAAQKYWPNPARFDPTRFLDKKGKVIWPSAFVPFGMGPRNCLGEGLAKMELFLFFTAILQSFTLKIPDGEPVPSLKPCVGINMCPQVYQVSAIPR